MHLIFIIEIVASCAVVAASDAKRVRSAFLTTLRTKRTMHMNVYYPMRAELTAKSLTEFAAPQAAKKIQSVFLRRRVAGWPAARQGAQRSETFILQKG